MRYPRILVAGLGNIFFGDDGFGVETVRALLREPVTRNVTVKDFGIRSYALACAMSEEYEVVVFVDATSQGAKPGTLFLIELDTPGQSDKNQVGAHGHSLDPIAVMRLAASFGTAIQQYYLVGCEPAVLEPDDGRIALSKPVRAAVPNAVAMIKSLLVQTQIAASFQPSYAVEAATS